MAKAEYFADGRVPADDDAHHMAVEQGLVPENCRLGGVTIDMFRRVLDGRGSTEKVCSLCPYPHRHICGGPQKKAAPIIERKELVAELAENAIQTLAIADKAKRDIAKGVLRKGLEDMEVFRRAKKK